MVKWFLLEDGKEVDGPFETHEIKSQVSQSEIHRESLIWGRLLKEWISVGEWVNVIDDLIAQVGIHADKSRLWHYSQNGETFGPFSRADLIDKLFELKSLARVYLWTNGMDEWLPIHEFHDIMDDVGVNQRVHKRAKVDGKAILSRSNSEIIAAGRLATISEGGVGFYDVTGLYPGEEVSLELKSDQFKKTIHVKGEVRYISENNFIGVKFTNVHSESMSQIIEYVKNAEEDRTDQFSSAA